MGGQPIRLENGKQSSKTCDCPDEYGCNHYNNPPLQEKTSGYWKTPDGIRRRIRMLSQDFTYKTVNGAVKRYGQTNGALWLYWQTVGDDRVCAICSKAATGGQNGFYRPYWFTPAMPAHSRCFLPDTLVDTHRGLIPIPDVTVGDYVLTHQNRYRLVRQTHKKEYSGEIRNLLGVWMTANHSVLTPEGWRRSDSIQNGDKVIISTLHSHLKNTPLYIEPDITPSMSREKNLLSSVINPFGFRVMPVSPINLDTKFNTGNGEVEVIDVEGKNRDNNYSSIIKDGQELLLQRTENTRPLNTFSNFNSFSPFDFASFSSLMRVSDLVFPLGDRHTTPFESLGFTLPSYGYTGDVKSGSYGSPRNVVPFSDGVFRHARFIEADDFKYRQIMLKYHYKTPTIQTDSDIYKGFVYNLTVDKDESYAVGQDRLLVHNCRCQWYTYFTLSDKAT